MLSACDHSVMKHALYKFLSYYYRFLSCAAVRTSLQDCRPALDLSFSTVRRQVVFPSGVHVRAVTQ